LIHRELGDNRGAINDHTQVIRLVPDWANAYYNRGLSYRDLGEKPQALEDFKKAAELYKQQNRREDYQDAIDRIKELLSGRV
jgi:tetratricopeptide (TPR) repeat protein